MIGLGSCISPALLGAVFCCLVLRKHRADVGCLLESLSFSEVIYGFTVTVYAMFQFKCPSIVLF